MNLITSRAPWFAGGLIVGLAVGGAWHFGYFSSFTATADGEATSTTPSLPPNSGDVAVGNQPAGDTVMIDSVTVPPPGVWVAIQDVNEDGSLGNVLGAALVGHPASNVTVQLLRDTLPGQQYAVTLYRNDSNGEFNIANESAYIDFDTGQPVEELFTTSNN